MADSTKQSSAFRSMMNPWVLHLRKLDLELKCPLCLELFKQPSLLPCDHIFCKSCLPDTTKFRSECPLCDVPYVDQDLRPMSSIENIVTVIRSLNAATTSRSRLVHSGSSDSGFVKSGKESFGDCLKNNSNRDKPLTLKARIPAWFPLSSYPDQEMDLNVGDENEQNANTQTDTHQVYQPSAGSPPSTGDIKSSENDSCEQSTENCRAQGSAKRTLDDKTIQERNDSPNSATDVSSRDSKRHKMLDYDSLHKCSTNSENDNSDISNCQLDLTSVKNSEELTPASLPDSSTVKTLCGFCQSSEISTETGPMLHFINGRSVEADKAYSPSAIHAHRICIDWAPQAYFVDDQTVGNLKSELVRGAKLKCSVCDRKGAALGCYHKSCRKSYHVTCAMGISGCRWDYDNFLLLCPTHTSVRFPNEKKSKSKNRVGNCQIPSQRSHVPDTIVPSESNFRTESSIGTKEWVFCGSALSPQEKSLLADFGTKTGVPVTKLWRPDVTHVIAATDENGACTRTLKVLMAILHGKWVLTTDWVKACLNSIEPVPEEAYEVTLDNHGCQNGPKTGRLSVLNNEPKLFSGFDFYFSGDFVSGYKEDLKNLVKAAGGNVLENKEDIVQKSHDKSATPSRKLVVYNLDPPHGCQLGEEVTVLWQRANEAEDLAAKIGSQVIGHTWLLESIASYKLQPLLGLHETL